MRGIVDPRDDRLTDELFVIGDDFCVTDTIAAGLEKVGCGGAGLVHEIISRGCIAHGQHGCGHGDHGIRVSGGVEIPVGAARDLFRFFLDFCSVGSSTVAYRYVQTMVGTDNCS